MIFCFLRREGRRLVCFNLIFYCYKKYVNQSVWTGKYCNFSHNCVKRLKKWKLFPPSNYLQTEINKDVSLNALMGCKGRIHLFRSVTYSHSVTDLFSHTSLLPVDTTADLEILTLTLTTWLCMTCLT